MLLLIPTHFSFAHAIPHSNTSYVAINPGIIKNMEIDFYNSNTSYVAINLCNDGELVDGN